MPWLILFIEYYLQLEMLDTCQNLRMLLFRKKPTLRRTCLRKPVLEDSHRLSFIRTHKDLLLYLLFDKAAEQFLKHKYADELAAEELMVAF